MGWQTTYNARELKSDTRYLSLINSVFSLLIKYRLLLCLGYRNERIFKQYVGIVIEGGHQKNGIQFCVNTVDNENGKYKRLRG